MKISVVIPTYNRAEVLRRTLNLLATQTYPDFEVVVVDDGSTDTTARLLAEFQKKVDFLLQFISQENQGQAVARNRALEKISGEIVLFLGDDMLPQNNLLEVHANFHKKFPDQNFACLGLVRWHPEIRVSRFMRWLTQSGVQFKFNDLEKNSETDFWRFYTANLSLKSDFLGSEKFSEEFSGWGFEDAELGYRLQQKSLKLLFEPEAIVEHYHEISADSLAQRQFEAGKNFYKFQKMHPELRILPQGLKLLLQKLVANLLPFTFYGRAKKAFLRGIAEVRRES
ncbi:MAG: glycosyltransferase [Candidatus Peribacteraceae bacterium]|nr:glycosyltransferase [Candidatus Peribacteraceae bacterium]